MTPTDPQQRICQSGFWLSILTFIFTLVALVIAITTPPRSGPFCSSGCIDYPYIDAAAFVPRDYLWMWPALLLTISFLALVACIHYTASSEKKIYSHLALLFAAISTTVLAVDYFIQLFVMQPSLLKGETEGLSLFSQYNPHGIFIALEDLGYLMMSMSFLFLAFVFKAQKGVERAIRRWFFTGFVLAIASLIILLSVYGLDIEYRFECAIILINWCILTVTAVLLSIFFRRLGRQE
jgi:hypothetical protein